MYFSKTFIASALLGLGTATTHVMGEAAAAGGGLATSSTSAAAGTAIAASETLQAVSTGAAAVVSSAESKGSVGTAAASSGAAATGSASAGKVATHIVQVGGSNGSLTFTPENVVAAAGDLVQFQFYAKNHSVVQSTFDKPCVPIQNVNSSVTSAFFSGFMPTNATVGATSNVLTYTIHVKDTKPLWFYCSQAKHCQGGMVGAINAASTGNKTMSAFKALAAQATENLSPGQAAGSGTQAGTGAGTGSGSGTGAGTGAGAGGNVAGGAGGTAGTGAGASSTDSSSPAQVTTNAAPSTFGAQSLFGLTLAAVAAMMLL